MANNAVADKPVAQQPKQPVTSIEPPKTPVLSTRQDDEAYIRAKGWLPAGMNEHRQELYADPIGTLQKMDEPVRVVLPDGSKGEKLVKQVQGAPIPWNYSLFEAVGVQRARDQAAK